MKTYFKFLLPMVVVLVLNGCKKDPETANLSTITYYPIITLNGDQWNQIPVGGSFTDPGATAKEGSADISVTASGTVDPSTPGVYTITYTAVNKDDYSATDYRYVAVIDPAVVGTDMSGLYRRNAGAQGYATITKVDENFYYCDNVGGIATPGPSVSVYFYHYAPGVLGVPFQRNPGNAFECVNSTVDLGVNYKWVVINSGYGTALRTFVKQ